MSSEVELTQAHLAELVMRAHVERLRAQHTPELGAAFARTRVVTQKSTFDRLDAGSELGRALRGHVAPLLWARLAAPYDERIAAARNEASRATELPGAKTGSIAELQRLVVTGPQRTVQDALVFLARSGGAVHEAEAEREEVRREIAARLGLVLFEDAALPAAAPRLAAVAARFLERTHDLARSVVSHFERGLGRECTVTELLPWLRGQSLHGLPARLSHRWLREVLPGFATSRLDPRAGEPLPRLLLGTLPTLLGITSFARALGQLGQAVVAGAPLAPVEWVRRVDGAFYAPTRIGLLFSSLLAEPAFLARASDASEVERLAFARSLQVAALFEARTLAARCMDRVHARGSSEEAEARVYVRPLPRGAFGLVPRWHDRAGARFCAYLDHPALRERALALFDEDWFRNPRSRSWAMLPPEPEPDFAERLDASCGHLVAHFEGACG